MLVVWAATLCGPTSLYADDAHLPAIKYGEKKVLAPGVWHQHASDRSVPWEIEIIEIDLTSPEIEIVSIDGITPSKREKVTDLANRGRAIAAVNAGFFNMETGDSVSHFELDDIVHAKNRTESPPRSTMGFTDDASQSAVMTIVDPKGAPLTDAQEWKKVVHAIGGGPGLIKNGEFTVTNNYEGFGKKNFIDKRHPRTAMGFNSKTNRMFWVVVDGRQPEWSDGMNLIELTHLMADLGCDNALNFDGGGSTTCVVNGKVSNRPSGKDRQLRAVSNAWIVRRRLPEIVIDNNDARLTHVGEWAVATENGCHGADVLIHHSKANDSQPANATWTTIVPAPGEYLIEAWWVAADDRTNTAKFSVTLGDATTEVIVSQRAFGSRWNSLGKFEIREGVSPRIELVSQGPESASIAADAIRLTRLASTAPTEKQP